jgi:hypothetical protein
MKTVALWIIAACYLSTTIGVYEDEVSGTNVYFGNLGWHFGGDK